jgi:hypothetical protein
MRALPTSESRKEYPPTDLPCNHNQKQADLFRSLQNRIAHAQKRGLYWCVDVGDNMARCKRCGLFFRAPGQLKTNSRQVT